MNAHALVGLILLVALALVACGRPDSATTTITTALPSVSPEPSAATPPASGTPFRLVTPGPTVPEGHWRWTGQVFDEKGAPLTGVCVHIGPGECRFNSIRTDDQGKWVIDFPQVDVQYDFHFVKDGYQRVDISIRTQGPGEIPIRMVPS